MSDASRVPDDPYANIAELYDLEHEGFGADIELLLNFAEVVGDPILELGCGSGRLLPDAARLYSVETGWRLDDGEWRLTSATWEPRL